MQTERKPITGITEELQDRSNVRGPDADEAPLNLVYAELHREAHHYFRRERIGHTVSESTVKRGWAIAKAWLHRELTR